MAPSRRICGGFEARSRIVEGLTPGVFPPSTISSTLPQKISLTFSGSEISPEPEMLALVAVRGKPDFLISSLSHGWAGSLIPTVPVEAVTSPGRFLEALRTAVRGPGQNFLAIFSSAGGISLATLSTISKSEITSKMGLEGSRPLRRNIRRTAAPEKQWAPSP